jgi:hypothetical protein
LGSTAYYLGDFHVTKKNDSNLRSAKEWLKKWEAEAATGKKMKLVSHVDSETANYRSMQNVGPAAFTATTACAENLTVFSTLKRTPQAMKTFVRSEVITVASMRTVKSEPTIQKNPQYLTCKILTYPKKRTMNAEIMSSQLLKSACQLNQPKKKKIPNN